MTRKAKFTAVIADADDVIITDEMFARAKRRDDLPLEIEQLLPRRRGVGKKTPKVALTLRISRPVIEAFRATGDGWQTRINDALERAAKHLPPQNAK